MNNDLISRQTALEAVEKSMYENPHENEIHRGMHDHEHRHFLTILMGLPSVQPDNQVHLCDSCKYTYPECPSGSKDVIYGNGKGNDNICACNKYEPSAQPELRRGEGS